MLSKNIVYQYKMESGGIADFIKFAINAINVAKKFKCNIYFDISHPIIKYLEIDNKYIFKGNINDYKQLRPFHKSGKKISELINLHNNIVMIPCDFYTEVKINYELDYDYRFNSPNISCGCNFFDYIKFTKTIYDLLKSVTPKEKYIAIHARLGDKFLETKPTSPYCHNDTRTIDMNNLDAVIANIIKSNFNKKIYLLADNNGFKNEIKKKYSDINIFNNEIINISCVYANSDYELGLKNTILEFLFMANAIEIHGLSYSGFSIISHILGKNTYVRYF